MYQLNLKKKKKNIKLNKAKDKVFSHFNKSQIPPRGFYKIYWNLKDVFWFFLFIFS